MTALKPGGLLANLDWKKEETIGMAICSARRSRSKFSREEADTMIPARPGSRSSRSSRTDRIREPDPGAAPLSGPAQRGATVDTPRSFETP